MTVKELSRTKPDCLIARAYAFAEKAHRAQKRKSGEPYFHHSLQTAEILQGWHMDDTTVAAGLLHDTVEDAAISLDTIKKEFGADVAFLVDGLTKLGRIKYRGAENKAENMRKMVLALASDLRVVFIKLADRLHNMKTLQALPPAKQKRVALETDEIYAPLAYRLGMYNVSGELQDLAFPYLYPREYRWLLEATKEQYETRLQYLKKIEPEVTTILTEHNIKPEEIQIRAKRYSSLYKKLLRRDMNIGKIYDLVAIRVIVGTVPECYAALGVIHEKWPPFPRRIKDYIAMPKPNGYRSLHTTVIGPEGKTIEFQIRTKEMHGEDEFGIAAHWIYDEKKRGRGRADARELAQELSWVQQLKDWQERFTGPEGQDPEEFIRAMKIDFFKDRIFAVTPRGDVIDLPRGATPVDFAYHIHTDVGNACSGAKVNGTLVPLDHELRSGDMVEVITQKGKKPSEDWLRFVKTAIARDHIRATLRGKSVTLLMKSGIAQVTGGAKPLPTKCALRIVVEDRVGLIKDISTVLANNHVNILSFAAENPKGGQFPVDKVEVQLADRSKIEKVIIKLKKIKGVREVRYKLS